MSAIRNKIITEEEYLSVERMAEYKSQYYKGEIFAMAGATFQHTLLVSNLLAVLNQKLKGKNCKPVGNDLRVYSPLNTLYTYPDISIICEEIVPSSANPDTVIQPTVLIEILSPSTR